MGTRGQSFKSFKRVWESWDLNNGQDRYSDHGDASFSWLVMLRGDLISLSDWGSLDWLCPLLLGLDQGNAIREFL